MLSSREPNWGVPPDMRTFAPRNAFCSSRQHTPFAHPRQPVRENDRPRVTAVSQASRYGHNFDRIAVHGPDAARIEVGAFSLRGPGPTGQARDKSEAYSAQKQDQTASVDSFAVSGTGIDIDVKAAGLTSSTQFPDGFRWTQTVTTNDPGWTPVGSPLVTPPVTYVDPTPPDDAKPFYWTDPEEAAHVGEFVDHPHRPANPGGTVQWNAILSLNGVKGTEVTRVTSLAYGFSVDSAGKATKNDPTTPGSVGSHTKALKSAFPSWTFK